MCNLSISRIARVRECSSLSGTGRPWGFMTGTNFVCFTEQIVIACVVQVLLYIATYPPRYSGVLVPAFPPVCSPLSATALIGCHLHRTFCWMEFVERDVEREPFIHTELFQSCSFPSREHPSVNFTSQRLGMSFISSRADIRLTILFCSVELG
jgi:hypothetical protein